MFTGIVNGTQKVTASQSHQGGKTITIDFTDKASLLKVGDSVSINGVCLTVVQIDSPCAVFDVIPQTLNCTNIDSLQTNDLVNIEMSLQLDSRIGGHMVQGHVDGTLDIEKIDYNGNEWQVYFFLPKVFKKLVVLKGFVAIDGVSLTVQAITATGFMVAYIPHTREMTVAGLYKPAGKVNFEVDMMARYTCHYLESMNA